MMSSSQTGDVLAPYAVGPLPCLSVCDVDVLWPNGWMDQDET